MMVERGVSTKKRYQKENKERNIIYKTFVRRKRAKTPCRCK